MGAHNGTEQGFVFISGQFSGTGQSAAALVKGYYNLTLWGTFSGTVELDKSFDGGSTYIPVAIDALGDLASYTKALSVTGFECENGVLYQFNCTAFTSGPIHYRLSGPNYESNLGVQSNLS